MQLGNKLQQMGRRRFLKTMGGLGVSAASLQYLTKDVVADAVENPKEEIPYVARHRHTNHEKVKQGEKPQREPVWKTVDRTLWERTETAHAAAAKLNERLKRRFGTSKVVAAVSSRGDQYEKQIEVLYDEFVRHNGEVQKPTPSLKEVKGFLPTKIEGEVNSRSDTVREKFDVITTHRRQIDDDCGSYYQTDYGANIPGGVDITGGTIATPATVDESGEQVMVSAGHIVGKYEEATQPSQDYSTDFYAGEWNETNRNDHGFYHSPADLQWKMGDEDGGVKTPEVVGILSWDTIKYHEGDENYTLKKQGATTGLSEGYIRKAFKDSNGVWEVDTNIDSWGGDSGGPVYRQITDPNYDVNEIYISHVHAYSDGDSECPRTKEGGNSMEYIEQELEITV